MSQDWLPGAEIVMGAQAGGQMLGGPCKTTHHITTGGAFDFLTGYLVQRGFEPTLLADPISGRIAQFLSAARSGYAMKHTAEPTNTQGDRHIQIEWCWDSMSNLSIDSAPRWHEVWARVLSFCRENGVPDTVPFGQINLPSSRDPGLWALGGHAGHFNAPGNDHTDGLPISATRLMFTSPLPTPPAPQEADVKYLIKKAGGPQVWVTDLITRRPVRDQADLGILQRIGGGKAVDQHTYTVPDGFVNAIKEIKP